MRNKIEILLFLIFIIFFGLGYVFFEQREFSEMENRYLTTRPEFTWKSFIEGDYTEEFEAYTADQIIGKDAFVQSNVAVNRMLGVSEINQVYIGKEGYLIQDYQEPGNILDENLAYLRAFANENPEVEMTFLVIPNVNEIYPEYLPQFAETYPQSDVIDEVQSALIPEMTVIDGTKALQAHKDEELYYKTDHHWTSLGAYYVYESFCHALSMEATPLEEFEHLQVKEEFYGSLYSKVPMAGQESDVVDIYMNPNGVYTVTNVTEQKQMNSLLDMSYAVRKDKYSVFFGGNYPLLVIESNSSNEEKVLIIKDSYANCMMPMLVDHYSEVHMMDLRYYHEDVGTYLQEQEITNVIFIHNVDYISTDNNFLWL